MEPKSLLKAVAAVSSLLLASTLLLAQQPPAGRDPLNVASKSIPATIAAPFATLHPVAAINTNAFYKDLRDRCPIARAADEAETAAARAYSSPRLTAALRNWDALWSLLNDPATPYADRIAAAYQGAPAVTPEVLPRFASIAASRAKTLPQVQFSPCDMPSWIQPETYVTMPPYPTTNTQRANAPFDWQLQRALDVLDREVKAYYADPARNPTFLRAMEAWQPADTYEALYRFETLLTGPRDIAFLQRLIRTTLAYPTAPHTPILRALTASVNDTPAFLERLHVAQLVLLAQTQNSALASDIASSVLRLASADQPGVKSATSALAIARWAQRPDLSPDTRSALLKKFAPMVDRFPLRWDANVQPNDKEILQILATFDTWLASHRSNLDEEAAIERPHFEQLLAELNAAGDRWTLP